MKPLKGTTSTILRNIFLTNNLSTTEEINGFRFDEMKIMSHCISGGKQVGNKICQII